MAPKMSERDKNLQTAMDASTRSSMMKRIVGGSAAEIVDTLGTIRETVGVPIEWVARSYFSDLGYERQVDLAENLAAEVMPFVPSA